MPWLNQNTCRLALLPTAALKKCHWVVGTDILKSYRKPMVNHSTENREQSQTKYHRNTLSENSSSMLLNPGLKKWSILSWHYSVGRATNHESDSIRTYWATNWHNGNLLFGGDIVSRIWSMPDWRAASLMA